MVDFMYRARKPYARQPPDIMLFVMILLLFIVAGLAFAIAFVVLYQ